jgi:molybdate transport system substrate-binding protein
MTMPRRGAAALALLLLAAGCGGEQAGASGEIVVAAASDLAAAMPELAAAFQEATGTRVVATLGSTGQLASQLQQGAPVDVFLSADATWVDRLEAAGRLLPGTRGVYAYGYLVLQAGRREDPPPTVASLRDAAWARIALANPEHAPYGRAARQALERAGIYDAVADRLVLGENVRQAVQFAEVGAVDAAITSLSLMDSARHRWHAIPQELHDPLEQTAAVVAGSRNPDAAASFIAFLRGEQGRAILQRHRFGVP